MNRRSIPGLLLVFVILTTAFAVARKTEACGASCWKCVRVTPVWSLGAPAGPGTGYTECDDTNGQCRLYDCVCEVVVIR